MTTTTTTSDDRADRVAARATGLGVGLITFMVTWLIAARITTPLVRPPAGAYTAMAIALTIGAVTAIAAAHRLVISLTRSATKNTGHT